MPGERLGIFARLPAPGQAKTRLIPALGADGAAALHEAMVRRTLATARQLAFRRGVACVLFGTGGDASAFAAVSGGLPFRPQGEGDLGARLLRAFDALLDGADAAAVVGTDCPELSSALLADAFDALRRCDLVLGPALDGGYWLIGMRQPQPALFHDMPWSTADLLRLSLQRAQALGLRVHLLPPLADVDRPDDLAVWERANAAPPEPRLSVVIPALDEASRIAAAVHAVRRPDVEVIVADGGSRDGTAAFAEGAGARVVPAPRGRGAQLDAGAALARAPVLLFLHADTRLPPDHLDWIERTLSDPRVALGAFRLRIDGPGLLLRAVETGVRLRCALCSSPYGDQGLFLRAEAFRGMGGFRPLPLFEDVDLVRRARARGRVVVVPAEAVTSARRWQRSGVLRTALTNRLCALGFALGVSAARLHAFREALAPEH